MIDMLLLRLATGGRRAKGQLCWVPSSKKAPFHPLINIFRYTMAHLYSTYRKHDDSSFWLRCLPNSANRIVSSSYLTLLVWSNAFLFYFSFKQDLNAFFPFCKERNVCLWESFQPSAKWHNVIRGTQIGWEWLWFFLSEIIYIRMFPYVLREIFACIASVLPDSPYQSTCHHTVGQTATLPKSPFILILNHSWMHLFLWKRFFFFLTS